MFSSFARFFSHGEAATAAKSIQSSTRKPLDVSWIWHFRRIFDEVRSKVVPGKFGEKFDGFGSVEQDEGRFVRRRTPLGALVLCLSAPCRRSRL